jgi:hypothetical protein
MSFCSLVVGAVIVGGGGNGDGGGDRSGSGADNGDFGRDCRVGIGVLGRDPAELLPGRLDGLPLLLPLLLAFRLVLTPVLVLVRGVPPGLLGERSPAELLGLAPACAGPARAELLEG